MSVNKVNSDGSLTKIAGGASEASNIAYDNTDSGLIASNVQDAIDEIAEGGGGGGLLPHLIIISEAGEDVVKAVKGSTEIIATETSAGHYECNVPEFGTWTIHAVLNGDDAIVNLVVDTVKVYTVDDSHWHADIIVTFPHSIGATCALSATGQTTQYATSSPYDFTVHEAGTYTLTVSYDGTDYTDTITVTTTGQEFESLLPAPEDAPTDDINLWLFYADIDNSESTYSSLADILADTTALSALMASPNAVDYLVRNTSWATDITAVEDAMTYIGLNNYASNTLLADSTWCNAIGNSTYFENVLNKKVPPMTSATTPEGLVSASSYYTAAGLWGGFNGVTTSARAEDIWMAQFNSSQYLAYQFTSDVRIYRADIWTMVESGVLNRAVKNYRIEYSADGSSYTTAGSGTLPKSAGERISIILDTTDSVPYWRFFGVNNYGDNWMCISEVQFYGREDV